MGDKKVIWKYRLAVTDEQAIHLPLGARILSLQVQNGAPYIWVLVDAECEELPRYEIRTIGTGHYVEAEELAKLTYLGTYQLPDLVFHVFYKIC